MAGVGKIGLVILLLVVCAPAAARLSRHPGYGQKFSLPGWLINVCQHRSGPRGTQRRSPCHPSEPLNAAVEQETQGDSLRSAARAATVMPEPVVVPVFVLPSVGIGASRPIADPAFRCSFLI